EKEFGITGTTLSDFNNFGTMKILQKGDLEPFTGKKLIISKKASDSLKVKIGDELKLNILGKEEEYKIAAISDNKGLFFGEKEKQFNFITPEENIFSIYGQENKYSMMFLSVDSKDLSSWIKDFNDRNKSTKIVASQIYDEKLIEQQLSMIRVALLFMLGIVLIMTSFIIYSSFKLIITERLSIIGTFLSQGATKSKIMVILLIESLLYGILGGIIGDLIGAGLTSLIAYLCNPLKEYGIKATAQYYPPYFAAGFVFAVILSIASTVFPILSIRKLPVKDVILNTISTSSKASLKSFIAGLICILVSVVLHFTGAKINYVSSVPELFMAFVGTILIIPKIVDAVCYPLVKLLRNLNGVSMLGFNNLRTSKVLINNIRLIAVSVIAIVMINSLSSSIREAVDGAYNTMKFDVRIDVNSDYVKNVDDIVNNYEDASNIMSMGEISTSLNGDTQKNIYLNYVDPEKYKTYEQYTVFKDKNSELDALNNNDDGVIISKQMSLRYNIKQNDTITLTTDNKKEKFKVLSIFDAKMMDSGNFNLISQKAALKHFDIKYPTSYSISTKVSANDAKKALEKKLKGLGTSIITKTEMQKQNNKDNKQMTDILGIFSYITMIIGAFGIVGNVSISFIQRKRDIAVMSSVGLSRGGRGYMIFLEGIFQALVGAVISLVAAYGINICLTDIMKFLTMGLDLSFPYKSIGAITIAVIVLMMITSLSSIFKSKKMQIVQEIKYE
ncbi:MAG: FtsX-like permease family protein, partial [Bacillota bacterium]|nr:FtsX-like permease family protein [Bacillota bacterium]